ncbi:MAG: Tetratricopeptide TPR_1 repeat-containing protein [Candidatus Pacebacteria bacterium GW2011_GWF2_38_9]|nr:MAG: hypothetical protein US01_C0001G0623 [candidate division TM6 bacterium GW2011_GWF2_28_16]KKQ88958.1 MAG: Tetratricopeptide TPR_1 repeat-containing protein [Candidatus Pacebacteria bacterium GW2011_GWF2_38_9]HAZ73133.1 hypothetical protein [Candidatus Paceibacterota bacterium]
MKKSLDIFIWAILLFLITPSGMALASWNAVPGDYTYSWKLSLEKVLLLFLSPSNKLQSSTQVRIAERRYSEFEQVLDSEYAIESLNNLNKQLETTSSDIQKISQTDSRDEVTDQYIVSLKKMSAALSEQKVKAETGEIAIVTQKETSVGTNQQAKSVSNKQTVNPTAKPTAKPTSVSISVAPVVNPSTVASNPTIAPTSAPVAENLPTEEENTAEVINEIIQTEENINQVIAVLEQEKKSNQDQHKSDDGSKEKKNDDEKDKKDNRDNKDNKDNKDNEERSQ